MTDDIERVKEATSITELIGNFVDLKKAGKNYKGLCPFHKEKTPSFVVSEERGTYKCFGCGEYGDVFSFLMKRDNMTFPEALEYLADKAGIILDNNRQNRREKINLEKYYKINEDARKFFYQNLLTNKLARDYLRKRQISDYTINEFSLGYAPDSWDSLLIHLTRLGHKTEDLLELGLIRQNQRGGFYDAYRNRLIFPIYNIRNRIVAFGGRTLDSDRAKYINSSDSVIYNKSKNLYGLNLIHNENDRDRIILVEGYMDVIGLRQSGFKNTVAALGTALTHDQAKLTKRYAKEIYLCYDSDEAGIKASLRAIDVYREIGAFPKVISLEDGLDPDDFIKKYSKEAFENKIKEAQNYLDFQIDLILKGYDPSDPSKVEKVIEELAKIIDPIESEILKDEYIEKVASKININPISLASDLNSFKPEKTYKDRAQADERANKKRLSLPKTLVLALIFAIESKDYYEGLKGYLSYLEDYGLLNIYDYIKRSYEEDGKDRVDLEAMAIDLGLDDRQIRLLSFDNIADENEAFNELRSRVIRFDLQKEKEDLRRDISMMSSLEDDPDMEEKLKEKINRLAQIEIELKTNKAGGI